MDNIRRTTTNTKPWFYVENFNDNLSQDEKEGGDLNDDRSVNE